MKAFIVVLLLFVLISSNVSAQINVSSCTTITSPGYYVLNQNINNSGERNCIEITSSDVIFDGNGYTLDGKDRANARGVYAYSSDALLTNVTVKNLNMINWGNDDEGDTDWGYGIYYKNTANGRIADNVVSSNKRGGIRLENSNNNTLINNILNSNKDGISLESSDDNELTHNIVSLNKNGIYFQDSNNNSIYNNFFNNSKNFKIQPKKPGKKWSSVNEWNITKTIGTNILGGYYIAGNVWADPSGTGFSQTCPDDDGDGICDYPYNLSEDNIDYLPLKTVQPSDTIPPIINSVTLNNTAPVTGQDILVTVNATDDIAVTGVEANGFPLTNQGGDIWNGTITAIEGTHSVNVSAHDIGGNIAWNNSTGYTATTPDDTPPIINNVTLNNTAPLTGQDILVTVNATDNIAVTGVEANGFPLTNQGGDIWNGTITAIEGIHSVNVAAHDIGGNIAWNNSTGYTATTPDDTPPIINNVTLNNTAPLTGQDILVTVNATDNIAVTGVEANGFPLTNQGGDIWNGTITAIEGTHSVNVSAHDAAGNVAWNNSTGYTATTPPGGTQPGDGTTPPGGTQPGDGTTPPGGTQPGDGTTPPGGTQPGDGTTSPGGTQPTQSSDPDTASISSTNIVESRGECGRNVYSKESFDNIKQYEYSRETYVHLSRGIATFTFTTIGIVQEAGYTPKTSEGCMSAKAELLKAKPSQATSDAPGTVYFNVWIGPPGYSDSPKIENPYIIFSAPDEKGKSVKLMMLKDGTWIELETTKIGTDTYKASTSGFGSFAITSVDDEPAVISPITLAPSAAPAVDGMVSQPANWSTILLLLVLIAIAAIIYSKKKNIIHYVKRQI